MGYIDHRGMIVTAYTELHAVRARDQAIGHGLITTTLVYLPWNGYRVFFVTPCGSKAGREEEQEHTSDLDKLAQWLREQRSRDGVSPYEWLTVAYGSDSKRAVVVDHEWSDRTPEPEAAMQQVKAQAEARVAAHAVDELQERVPYTLPVKMPEEREDGRNVVLREEDLQSVALAGVVSPDHAAQGLAPLTAAELIHKVTREGWGVDDTDQEEWSHFRKTFGHLAERLSEVAQDAVEEVPDEKPKPRSDPRKPRHSAVDYYDDEQDAAVEPDVEPDRRGLMEKFIVTRVDGKSAPGEKHHGCRYFVLDIEHDPHACAALRAYAESCKAQRPALAADLLALGPEPRPDPLRTGLKGIRASIAAAYRVNNSRGNKAWERELLCSFLEGLKQDCDRILTADDARREAREEKP